MINFENVNGRESLDGSFFQQLDKEENEDEDFDACFHQPGKKRRLTTNQVQFLEKTFELENKLCQDLPCGPRQITLIATSPTRNLVSKSKGSIQDQTARKDYDSLKSGYERLKVDYENLLKESKSLKNEVNSLEKKFLSQEKGKENLDLENLVQEDQNPILRVDFDHVSEIPMVLCK
ncbi:hypothetical protein UlMin_038370 [Ulmus minor]